MSHLDSIRPVEVEQQGLASNMYLLWERSHDTEETCSRVFHPLLGDLWLFNVPLSFYGLWETWPPREIIRDLDWGWGSCEEASPWQVGNQPVNLGAGQCYASVALL
ncbi:hypothetical protein U9M48_010664 [Paspalum notatum var. saurae]|uniref:Uncharacterized protein n=1 Tax=Paspalum notatum var. saurae TaxID=547442 RepID=A0AAQ3SU31_PASNO